MDLEARTRDFLRTPEAYLNEATGIRWNDCGMGPDAAAARLRGCEATQIVVKRNLAFVEVKGDVEGVLILSWDQDGRVTELRADVADA